MTEKTDVDRNSGSPACSPVLCREHRPIDVRVLGWCADEKVWKCGFFMRVDGVTWFKHEGHGPIYGEHEVSHWMPMPDAPKAESRPKDDGIRGYRGTDAMTAIGRK